MKIAKIRSSLLARLASATLAFGLASPAAFGGSVEYYHLDALGSVRVVTDGAGAVIERHDYLPFGEECTTGPCAGNAQAGAGQPVKFTGKERDKETGLDYFGARYYGQKNGRFTNVDPVHTWNESLADPQRLNRYAYARNGPLRFADPDGRVVRVASSAFSGPPPRPQADASWWRWALWGVSYTMWVGTGGGAMPDPTLGMMAVPGAAATVPSALSAVGQLTLRAEGVHGVLDPIAQGMRTTAALETTAARIIGGGGRDLTGAQLVALQPGETAAALAGAHAEVTVMNQAALMGEKFRALAATRAFCPECTSLIQETGGILTSDRTAVWLAGTCTP